MRAHKYKYVGTGFSERESDFKDNILRKRNNAFKNIRNLVV